MIVVRHLLAQRTLALLICAAALLLKLLVPAGWMIDAGPNGFGMVLCPAAGPVPAAAGGGAGMAHQAMPAAQDGHGGNSHRTDRAETAREHTGQGEHGGAGQGKGELPCAWSGLSATALGAIDPVLLAGLIAFIIGSGFAGAARPTPIRSTWLRPPLRGPPATA